MEPLRQDDPSRVGPYQLQERLGRGGMGEVFFGWSPGGRPVAVKLVRSALAGDQRFRRRFAQEAKAARQVGGFYTAQVVDSNLDADPPWLVTAYIPGPSLQEAVKQHGPLPILTLNALGAGLAEGLKVIHQCGLVHRDLKPSNVILGRDGPRIIDFGIARALDTTSHTTPQAALGTPPYMSPEQARGDAVGPPSDVFSFASVLVYAATGRAPFGTGPAAHVLSHRIVHDEPDLTGLPASLRGLVAACLAKDPAARPSAAAILGHLTGAVADRWLPPDVITLVDERERITERGPAESPGPRPEARKEPGLGRLTVGNFSGGDMDVIVDGGLVGTVRADENGTFRLASGPHTMQVKAESGSSAVRRVVIKPDAATRLAFEVPPGAVALPVPWERGNFSGKAAKRATWIGVIAGLVAAVLFGVLALKLDSEVLPVLCPPVGGVVGFLSAEWGRWRYPSSSITLNQRELRFEPGRNKGIRKIIAWSKLEQVSVIDEVIVLWYRDKHRPRNGRGVHGGYVLCNIEDVTREHDGTRFRAALEWCAADLYVEQPT